MSVFIALATAKPSYIHEPVIAAAPIVTKTIVQPAPLLVHSSMYNMWIHVEKKFKNINYGIDLNQMSIFFYSYIDEHVGSVLSSIPTGVSAHSSSVVHSTSPVVSSVVTPVHKTIVSSPIVAEPILSAPILKTVHHAPAFYSQPLVSSPLIKTYAAAPAFSAYSPYAHNPLAYSASIW